MILPFRLRSALDSRSNSSDQTRPRSMNDVSGRRNDVTYRDLRDFIDAVEKLGVLRRIAGADPHFELGGITEVAAGLPECPALLFETIKGYAPGVRVFTNATTSPQRAALALGLDPTLRPLDALKAWMTKRQTLTMQKPAAAKNVPALENSVNGDAVDLGTLPAP